MIKITIEHCDGIKETVECDAYLLSVFNEQIDGGLNSQTKIEGQLKKGALLLIYTTIKDYIVNWKEQRLTEKQVDYLDKIANKVIFKKL